MSSVEVLDAPEAVAELVVDPVDIKKSNRAADIYPAEIVEGMLAVCLSQIKASLDVVYENPKSMKPLQNVRACYLLTGSLIDQALDRLKGYHDASLNVKHRLSRKVLRAMSARLLENDVLPAKRMHNKRIAHFAHDMVQFLTAFHLVLSENTPKNDRYKIAEAFCGEEG